MEDERLESSKSEYTYLAKGMGMILIHRSLYVPQVGK